MSKSCNHSPIACIVPPHMLEAIVRNGSAAAKAIAQANLDSIERARVVRAVMRNVARPVAPLAPAPAPARNRTIYSAKNGTVLPGSKTRVEGQPASGDVAIDEAYDGLGATFDLYWEIYQRNSIDDAGQPLDGSVHYGLDYNNAFWDGHLMVFGDGDGAIFNRFTIAVDIMGHELSHGVVEHTCNLNYNGQSGALNESVSDVFGSLVKQYKNKQDVAAADWLIGAGIFAPGIKGVALRSMRAPGTAYNDPVLGADPQPAHMNNYVNTSRDNGGVHINSGIPNHAFYLLATALGGFAWGRAGNIWYRTLLDPRLKPNTNFQEFADITADVAAWLYGRVEQKAVIDAWAQVGIVVYDEAKWVTALYADVLGRAPDKAGLDGWVAARLSGSSLESVARGFLDSHEYCTTLATSFYATFLGRAPDPGGLQFWTSRLESGVPRHEIQVGFLDSTEFKQKNAPPAAFVEALYNTLLGRPSDPNGKQGWIDALAAGATTADVARGFLFSQEFCIQRVTDLYQTLLNRVPSAGEMAGWVGMLCGGEPMQKVQVGFLTSPEYRARALTRF